MIIYICKELKVLQFTFFSSSLSNKTIYVNWYSAWNFQSYKFPCKNGFTSVWLYSFPSRRILLFLWVQSEQFIIIKHFENDKKTEFFSNHSRFWDNKLKKKLKKDEDSLSSPTPWRNGPRRKSRHSHWCWIMAVHVILINHIKTWACMSSERKNRWALSVA